MQVRKLLMAGYDMRQVTGDDISKEEYVNAQQEVSSNRFPCYPASARGTACGQLIQIC